MPDRFRCPDPTCDAAEWEIHQDAQTGELVAVCAHCKGTHPIYTGDDLADAEACGVQWAENLARDIAAALDGLDRPDASEWAERLHWFANRIRGGQLSIHADEELRARFGLPAGYLADKSEDPE